MIKNYYLLVIIFLLSGCDASVSINESNTKTLGPYNVKIKPFSHSTTSNNQVLNSKARYQFNNKHSNIVILDGQLYVDGKNYGHLAENSNVLVDDGVVSVNEIIRYGFEIKDNNKVSLSDQTLKFEGLFREELLKDAEERNLTPLLDTFFDTTLYSIAEITETDDGASIQLLYTTMEGRNLYIHFAAFAEDRLPSALLERLGDNQQIVSMKAIEMFNRFNQGRDVYLAFPDGNYVILPENWVLAMKSDDY